MNHFEEVVCQIRLNCTNNLINTCNLNKLQNNDSHDIIDYFLINIEVEQLKGICTKNTPTTYYKV